MRIHILIALLTFCLLLPTDSVSGAGGRPRVRSNKPLPAYIIKDRPTDRPFKKGLLRTTAQARSLRIKNVRYNLTFHLDKQPGEFKGEAKIAFELIDAQTPLTLDFTNGTVESFSINGSPGTPLTGQEPKDALRYNGLFIQIPAENLTKGENNIHVRFRHIYSKTGAGLYRFQDPADKRIYLYSDHEPYDANKLFPCFDQPDLKGRYTVTVHAPTDWEVVTSVPPSNIQPLSKKERVWTFPESPPFSTYLFSLHAGSYVLWNSSAGDIPLRLMARRSLAQYVQPEEWFKTTRQGLAFFNTYFDYPYPFKKYDQIIVPDFNSGAMENVAAVTFSENFIRRGKSTWEQRESQANVILHEMAHMWFGNLVTMKWWDDLWLNESFASYMASLALHQATEFQDAWEVFFLDTKQWAYWEDQLVTTHPIEADAVSTEEAFANFDGITYGKGASVLKQVSHLIGKEQFRNGVRQYFKKHAFKNAKRKDFIAELEAASGTELSEWTRDWLKREGVNSLRAAFTCDGETLSSLSLHQQAPHNWPLLRSHKTRVSLLSEDGNDRLIDAAYSGESTNILPPTAFPCPVRVFPNAEDQDYVKVRLDPLSLKHARKELSLVKDPLERAMLWMTLWDMVQDAELPLNDYMHIVLSHLPAEKHFQLTSKILETLYGKRTNSTSVLFYLSGEEGRFDALRADFVQKMENLFWSKIQFSRADDWDRLYFDSYIRVAETPEALTRLTSLLKEGPPDSAFDLDQDRRWEIIRRLNRLNASKYRKLIKAEKKKDKTRRGQTAAISADAIRPHWKTKRKWLNHIVRAKSGKPLAELKAAMRTLFPYEQTHLHKKYEANFFHDLSELSTYKPNEFLGSFTEYLVPANCLPEDTINLEVAIRRYPHIPPIAMKELRIAKQQNQRCLAIREKIQETP